jgi:hypothetical protein
LLNPSGQRGRSMQHHNCPKIHSSNINTFSIE